MANLIVEGAVRKVLHAAGWRFHGVSKSRSYEDRVTRLQVLLDKLYVDNRRQAAVRNLEEARRIADTL